MKARYFVAGVLSLAILSLSCYPSIRLYRSDTKVVVRDVSHRDHSQDKNTVITNFQVYELIHDRSTVPIEVGQEYPLFHLRDTQLDRDLRTLEDGDIVHRKCATYISPISWLSYKMTGHHFPFGRSIRDVENAKVIKN